jgi:UDP-2,3-diacylglucosamine pyrophosphatase LpxH
VFDFLRRNRENISGVVLMGDVLDCQSISRHTEMLPGLREKGGFQKDIDGFERDILDPIDELLPKAQKAFIEGNHCNWLAQFLDKQPELVGALSWPKLLHLKERGYSFIPQGEAFHVGRLVVIHGDQVGSSPNAAKKAVDSYCSSVVMGHCHAFGAATKTSEVKKRDKWIGVVLPCLTTLSPKYGKGRPNAHVNGFGIVERFEGGKLFNLYVPIISEGKFCFAGQVYGR